MIAMFLIMSAWLARLLAASALAATLLSLLTMWMVLQDPVGTAMVVQREGLAGLAAVLASSVWRQISFR